MVTYPESYGSYRIQTRSEDEIHRVNAKGTNVLNFFSGHNWKIHPDWYVTFIGWIQDKHKLKHSRFRLYCKHSNESFSSPETELIYFLERMRQPGWKWPLNRSPPPPEHVNIYSELSLITISLLN